MTVIDTGYRPHKFQLEAHHAMRRFTVVVAHRRFGKTFLAVNALVDAALRTTKHQARFAYIAPFLKQAKGVAWDYLKRFAMPVPGAKANESELAIDFPNGARVRLYGSRDGQDEAMRGLYFDGVVADEVADFDPETWPTILRPALSDRKGWTLFIGTPKGMNAFHELYEYGASGKDHEWAALMFRVDETGLIDAGELAANRATMSEAQYAQEWLCDFNASTDNTLVTLSLASEAAQRRYKADQISHAPRIIGVDVARFGDDRSVIFRRQGLMAFQPVVLQDIDNMSLAARVAQDMDDFKADGVFIDVGGGQGVIDRLRQLGRNVIEVNFGSKPSKVGFLNKRAEMWSDMAEWLKAGGAIPNDPQLKTDLCVPTYSFNAANLFQLESKDKIKERGMRSPDLGDALALTFAYPVAPRGMTMQVRSAVSEYDPYKDI